MQYHIVFGIAQGTEHRLLGTGRRCQHGQRLVAMASEHHVIKTLAALGTVHRHPFAVAFHASDRAGQANALSKRRRQGFDIASGAAFYHAPLRAVGDGQQAVVLEEAHEELQRKPEHVRQRHGPDCRTHRHDVVVNEALAITTVFQIFAQRGVGRDTLVFQVVYRLTIEAHDIAQHAPEPGRQQVAALGKQAVEVVAVIFDAGARVVHRKAHFGRLETHVQLTQQFDEVRVGPVVEHNETGIDGIGAAFNLHINRVGMPADPVGGLEDRHLMPAIEQIGAGQPGDTAANDCNFH